MTLGLLEEAELELLGRVLPASNHTYLARLAPSEIRVVYKPISGERPLWDFPDGTLAKREYAAFLVSEATGWAVVPPTALRADGPAGPGMVQLWQEPDPTQAPVDLVPQGTGRDGYRHVLDAVSADDELVSLMHEDTPSLRRMAVLDLVLNNTDRKGGHVLAMPDGHRFGVDHGVCFHVDDKLRTVLWGWAGEPLWPGELGTLRELRAALHGSLGDELAPLLSDEEIAATVARTDRALGSGTFPLPSADWPSIPWPPV